MKNRREHKRVDINYFLIPMSIVLVLFFVITFSLVQSQIKTQYDHLEDIAIKLTNSYAHSVVGQTLAMDIATQLLEEKLEIAMNAIVVNEHHWSNDVLTELGEQFGLDALYVYSPEGVIIQSMNGEYIGWTAYPSHPVHNFMISGASILIEDIRKDSESDRYFKYGYLHLANQNAFIQVGLSAEKVTTLLELFSVETTINEIKEEAEVEALSFINLNKEVSASTMGDSIGMRITDTRDLNELKSSRIEVTRLNDRMLRVFVPVERLQSQMGWLAMYWPSDETDRKVNAIIWGGVFLYIVFSALVGFIIFYAYRKDKSNYKLAYYDGLTGLPNRSYLKEHLESVYNEKPVTYSAFIAVNCKNLSTIISTYGYSFGDSVLKMLASKLSETVEKDDRLYRFSSDRFVILIKAKKNIQYQMDLAKNIIRVFKQPLVIENAQQFVAIEVGIVELDGHQKEVAQVLQEASITLSYLREKSLQVGLYNAQMEAHVKNEDFIEHVIRRAIRKSPETILSMVYQPLVNSSEGRIVGFEALLRISTDTGLIIPPLAIISVAEKRQLIFELGNRILNEVCLFVKRMNDQGIHDMRVAINISGLQLLREEFIDTSQRILQESGVDTSSIEFEITESILLGNLEIVNQKLNQLRNIGITIALDDFGTGYSSLSRLRDLNIDIVKIDKYFIDRIELLEKDRLITGDIISMAHKIGLAVVAEGVETRKQWEYLKAANCDVIQGYYVSKPVSEDDAMSILIKNVYIGSRIDNDPLG